MHVQQILVAAATFLCVSGLLLPARATAEPAPTPSRDLGERLKTVQNLNLNLPKKSSKIKISLFVNG
jgi:hypothetical protein